MVLQQVVIMREDESCKNEKSKFRLQSKVQSCVIRLHTQTQIKIQESWYETKECFVTFIGKMKKMLMLLLVAVSNVINVIGRR